MKYIIIALLFSGSFGVASEWTQKHVRMRVTAYCMGACCCGTHANGETSIGRNANKKGVAVDPKVVAYGSRIDIPGYGNWMPADDCGGAIKGNRLDVRLKTHKEALRWGVKYLRVRVWTKKKKKSMASPSQKRSFTPSKKPFTKSPPQMCLVEK